MFNGHFDVNVMDKLFSLVIALLNACFALSNACACQMVRLFSLVIAFLCQMLASVMCLLCQMLVLCTPHIFFFLPVILLRG